MKRFVIFPQGVCIHLCVRAEEGYRIEALRSAMNRLEFII